MVAEIDSIQKLSMFAICDDETNRYDRISSPVASLQS